MIVIGADMHKRSHTVAAVVAGSGELLGDQTIMVGRSGFVGALDWARGLGEQRVWVLEDCRHVSGSFERFLLEHGERVVKYRAPARCFGIRPSTAWVESSDEKLVARFDRLWRVPTPRQNVTGVAITGPCSLLKPAAPAALRDRSLIAASHSPRAAIAEGYSRSAKPVRGVDLLGLLRHPELTVTAADTNRLADVLNERMTP